MVSWPLVGGTASEIGGRTARLWLKSWKWYRKRVKKPRSKGNTTLWGDSEIRRGKVGRKGVVFWGRWMVWIARRWKHPSLSDDEVRRGNGPNGLPKLKAGGRDSMRDGQLAERANDIMSRPTRTVGRSIMRVGQLQGSFFPRRSRGSRSFSPFPQVPRLQAVRRTRIVGGMVPDRAPTGATFRCVAAAAWTPLLKSASDCHAIR